MDDLATAAAVIGVVLLGLYLLIRPRTGGPNAPPTVLSSPVVPVPIFGMPFEFGLSPVKMITRCYQQYGSVFTIPVRV